MPYSYYQMVRFVSFVGFAALAYLDFKDKRYLFVLLSAAGVILFNPLFKVTFKRPVWQDIDEAIAYILVVWILIEGFYLLYNTIKRKRHE
jgi:uncharacterized protein DUF6804